MNKGKKILLLGACLIGVVGCAGTGTSGPPLRPDENDMAQVLGCTKDQVAICVEVNCRPEHYRCANRGDVRDMFRAGEFRH